MSRRKLRYPEGSPLNLYNSRGRFQPRRRGFNSALWGWRVYKLKNAAPALLVLLLLTACALLAAKGA